MGAALGLIGPLASLAGGIFGLTNSSSNPIPKGYQPTGLPGADQSLQGGITNLTNSSVPGANAAVDYLYNNPGAPGAVAGANVAGGLGEAAGLTQFGQGGNLINTGNSIVPYATAAYNSGFDPQGAMYGQAFQQNTDQTRALLEARGIDSTPYGAGVEADSNRKFNTDWGFNQLARQQQGAATGNSILGTSASDITAGANLSGMAPGTFYGGASMPYNTNQTIGTNQLGAIGQGQAIQQVPIMDWMNYLNYGNSAAQVGQQGQQQQFNQNQVYGQGIGAGIQGLAKQWNNLPGGQAGGGFATNQWAQNNPGVAGSAYQGPVGP